MEYIKLNLKEKNWIWKKRTIEIQIKKEIDVVIEKEGKLSPIEIKKSSYPDDKSIRSFSLLKKTRLM